MLVLLISAIILLSPEDVCSIGSDEKISPTYGGTFYRGASGVHYFSTPGAYLQAGYHDLKLKNSIIQVFKNRKDY